MHSTSVKLLFQTPPRQYFIYLFKWMENDKIMDSIPGAYTDLLISKFVCFHRFKWPTDVDNDSILLDPVNLWLDCGQHSVWGAIKQDIGSRNNNLWLYICICTPPAAVVSHHNKHTSSLIVLSLPSLPPFPPSPPSSSSYGDGRRVVFGC